MSCVSTLNRISFQRPSVCASPLTRSQIDVAPAREVMARRTRRARWAFIAAVVCVAATSVGVPRAGRGRGDETATSMTMLERRKTMMTQTSVDDREEIVAMTTTTTTTTTTPSPSFSQPPPLEEEEKEEVVAVDDFELLDPPKPTASLTSHVATSADFPPWMAKMWRESVKNLDESARDELQKKMDVVPEVLREMALKPGQEMFVTFGTHSVKDFVFNWIEATKRLKLEPIFVGALDEKMYEACVEARIPSMLLTGRSVLEQRDETFITAKSEAFKKMGTVKTKFIEDLLELDVAPILSDADVVWMRDPREYFNAGTYKYADLLISSDCVDVVADREDQGGCDHVNFNTGVLHIRPTPGAKEFVRKWKDKVAMSTIAWMRDQPALNLLVREGAPALSPAVRVPDDKRGRPGYRSVVYAANNTLRLGVLPVAAFANGHTFFVQQHHVHHPEDGAPYSVHTTYQYGDSHEYAYGKRQRLRQHGLWFVDENAYWESGKYLTISTEGVQVRFNGSEVVGTGAEDYKLAITRHFEEDKLRRVSIRNGLALAKALGRTFVLPPARCFCDKIWNTLKGCRALGAETAHLPFECPMDHIYSVEHWFKYNVDFRPAGFLEDDRVPLRVKDDVVRVKIDDTPPRHSTSGSGDEVLLRPGFTGKQAVKALAKHSGASVIVVDKLGEGTFCGFGDAMEDTKFDSVAHYALFADQYFCFEEPWRAQGRPRGQGTEWEPRVVERHCGVPEKMQRRAATKGVVSEILKSPMTCSCEWGYLQPQKLAETTCGKHY